MPSFTPLNASHKPSLQASKTSSSAVTNGKRKRSSKSTAQPLETRSERAASTSSDEPLANLRKKAMKRVAKASQVKRQTPPTVPASSPAPKAPKATTPSSNITGSGPPFAPKKGPFTDTPPSISSSTAQTPKPTIRPAPNQVAHLGTATASKQSKVEEMTSLEKTVSPRQSKALVLPPTTDAPRVALPKSLSRQMTVPPRRYSTPVSNMGPVPSASILPSAAPKKQQEHAQPTGPFLTMKGKGTSTIAAPTKPAPMAQDLAPKSALQMSVSETAPNSPIMTGGLVQSVLTEPSPSSVSALTGAKSFSYMSIANMSPVPPPTLATITASVTVEPAEPFHLHDALVRFPVKDARRTTAGALDFLLSYVVSLEEKVTNLEKRAEKAEERLNVERQKHAGEIETLRAELANVKSFSEALALDEHSVQKTVEVEQAERKKLARKIDDERKQTVDAFEAFRSQLADVQSKANTASTVPQSFRQMIETESADRILMGKEIRELAGNAEARAKKADDNVKSRYSELNQRMIKVNARATKTERDLLSAERKSTAAHKKTTDKTAALDSQLSQQNNDAIVEKARTEKLVRQVDDLSNEFNVFGSRLAQLSSAVSILEAKQATFSTTSAVLEAEPRTLQNQVHQVSKLGSQEAIVGNVIQHLGSTVAELKEGKQDLKTKYETISATAADLQAKHATLSATVNKLASKHGDSNDFVREIQATDLEAQLAVLNKFKADTERKLGKFEKNLHHKSGQIINVEQDIEALKKSMGKLERQNSEAPRQTATPRSSVSGTSGLKAEMQPIVIDD